MSALLSEKCRFFAGQKETAVHGCGEGGTGTDGEVVMAQTYVNIYMRVAVQEEVSKKGDECGWRRRWKLIESRKLHK